MSVNQIGEIFKIFQLTFWDILQVIYSIIFVIVKRFFFKLEIIIISIIINVKN